MLSYTILFYILCSSIILYWSSTQLKQNKTEYTSNPSPVSLRGSETGSTQGSSTHVMGEISVHDEDEAPSGVFDAVDVGSAYVNTHSHGEEGEQT